MKRPDLRTLAANPNFIAGIYNYCDRWCERCSLSRRCLNYAMEEKRKPSRGAGARDLKNQAFWDELQDIFKTTIEMVREDARKDGIDLNDPKLQASVKAHERRVERLAAKHKALPDDALKYAHGVTAWLRRAKPRFRDKREELETKERLEIGTPMDEAIELDDLLEVIQFYQFFIHVKLSRSTTSQAEEELETAPEMRAFPKDSDGSAKIALIAIDRSLAAWTRLSQHFPEESDAILDSQVLLARLRTAAERLFPQARAFVRPGFDTGAKP